MQLNVGFQEIDHVAYVRQAFEVSPLTYLWEILDRNVLGDSVVSHNTVNVFILSIPYLMSVVGVQCIVVFWELFTKIITIRSQLTGFSVLGSVCRLYSLKNLSFIFVFFMTQD